MNANYSNSDNTGVSKRPRRPIIIICVLVLAIFALFVIVLTNNKANNSSFPKADQGHSTTFSGMSSFVNSGLTTEQVNALVKAFSKFSPTANNVTIDPTSLTPGSHDPNIINPFTIKFKVTIDSASYSGIASYSDLTSIKVVLTSSSGKQVYDSGVISAQQ